MNSFYSGNTVRTGPAASFSDLVQRIVQSNSGKQRAMQPLPQAENQSRDWEECRTLAEEALSNHNYARAEALWLKAVARSEQLPLRDWRRVYGLESLLSLYYSQGRFDEAEVFADRYAYQVQAVYGIDHLKTADAFNFLASIYFSLNRTAEAVDYAGKALSIYKQGAFPDPAKLAMVLYNLAVINHQDGDFINADRFYKEAYEMRRELFGEDAAPTRKVVESYNEMLADQESHEAARKIINRLLG
ncbi:MAG: tetratricopeptide repeat protein [Cyanobacteriota/Melainabacteria group bacterium]